MKKLNLVCWRWINLIYNNNNYCGWVGDCHWSRHHHHCRYCSRFPECNVRSVTFSVIFFTTNDAVYLKNIQNPQRSNGDKLGLGFWRTYLVFEYFFSFSIFEIPNPPLAWHGWVWNSEIYAHNSCWFCWCFLWHSQLSCCLNQQKIYLKTSSTNADRHAQNMGLTTTNDVV